MEPMPRANTPAIPSWPWPGGSGNADLDFTPDATGDTRQHFSIPKGQNLFLIMQWSDPFYTVNGVKSDLDMYLIKSRTGGAVMKGDTIAISNDDNIASQTPVEGLSYTNNNDTDTEFDLVISRRKGTADPARVKYISYGNDISESDPGTIQLEYFTHSSTVTGHHAATGTNSVAAAISYIRLLPEDFTAKGNPTFLFNPDGSPLATPVTRAKPDFASIDGCSTSFFGQKFTGQDPKDGFLFFGTSAAAPNAAAVAALLLQANPNFTPAQVNARLIATALDINTAGVDATTGAGLINAYDAVFGPQVPAAAPFVETFDSLRLSRAWNLQGGSYGRILVRNGYGPASAPGQLILDGILAAAGATNRRNIAELRLDLSATAAGGWVLTFKHRKFGNETDQAMPATFTNSSSTDGVALSVDGTNWFRLADITGTNATTSYKTVSVNLNDFATAHSLTLGSTVRIRFQSINTGEVDSTIPQFVGGRGFGRRNGNWGQCYPGPSGAVQLVGHHGGPVPRQQGAVHRRLAVCAHQLRLVVPRRHAGYQHRPEPGGDLQHGRHLRRHPDRDQRQRHLDPHHWPPS